MQLDSMIMAEDGNKERYSRKNVPALMTDMDSTEKVNQEKLDLSVTSSLKSKEISVLHDILLFSNAEQHSCSLQTCNLF